MDMPSEHPVSTKIEFAVQMKSPCCASKVEKALSDVQGIRSFKVDPATQRLIVEGTVSSSVLQSAIENKTGMSVVLLGCGSSRANLGAGVAAISVGSPKVKGVLRFVQTDCDTCIVEGTVDELPTSEPVYLALHESGDVSDNCYSCGPPLSAGGKVDGILGRLQPSQNKRADFRMTTTAAKVSEMYGHCVVIHKGDLQTVKENKSERLACGIVARSSGLFENSKRFCACDGVSIWEQRNLDREEPSI